MSLARGGYRRNSDGTRELVAREKVDLPRGGRCIAGRLARAYLNAAATPADEKRRTLRLQRYAARFVFGVSVRALARAAGLSAGALSDEATQVAAELRELDRTRNLGADAYLFAKDDFEGQGDGI